MVNLNLQRNQTTAAATSDNKASNTPDGVNRIILAALTTAMATFSMLLMALLVFVLKQSCVVCVTSAILSISMGILTWFGGADSDDNEGAFMAFRNGLVTRLASVILTIAATAGLYGSLGLPTDGDFTSSSSLVASSRSISASSDDSNEFTPPPVTASSNDRALTLAENLKLLNTRFFGAYWCSHCFEQKQTMGKDAMKNIPYIECSAEGKNSQADVCKKAKVPGYPTWEIGGKLFPGEMSIDELENIVRDVNVAKKS